MATLDTQALSQIALAIRSLSIDGVEAAKSGHPGLPLGAADMAATVWGKYLRFDPTMPEWANRDRFILSAGHGCMLLYSLLHLFGYKVSLDEVKRFRQWGSLTPGHPEFGITPGVEATTGPLGQGFANGVGVALSSKLLAARYDKKLFSHRVFAIVSDGDVMEGVAAEGASLAGHLGLDNLIYLYDDNKISLAGPTDVSFTESVPKRLEAMGWWTTSVDGHDTTAISQAIDEALTVEGKPKIICCRTTIGFGSPNLAGTHEVHGAPLGKDEAALTKAKLGIPAGSSFWIPEAATKAIAGLIESRKAERVAWEREFAAWKGANGGLAAQYEAQVAKTLPPEFKTELLAAFKEAKKDATRNLSSVAIQVCAKYLPGFIGGSADLEPSTKTTIKNGGEIQKGSFAGKNIRFGVREHGMGSAINGLAYQKCWFPFGATFLTFSDYMRPTVRLAALSELQSLFIFTHESFYLGEDGPTHQPVEHAASLRLIPNLLVFRPADGIEVAMSYYAALAHTHGPSTLLFTRQNLPTLSRPAGFSPDDILKGAYTVKEATGGTPDVVIVATGSEVSLALEAATIVEGKGKKVRVVSMPCVELFMKQPPAFRDQLIPRSAKRVSIEAGVTTGWERVVGSDATLIGLDRFGASAPAEVLAEKFGFTAQQVAEKM